MGYKAKVNFMNGEGSFKAGEAYTGNHSKKLLEDGLIEEGSGAKKVVSDDDTLHLAKPKAVNKPGATKGA